METDRELLKLAAKAAEIDVYEGSDGTIQNRPVWVFSAGGGMGTMPYEEQWNPLRDDHQAFRLAVKLQIVAGKYDDYASACALGNPVVGEVTVWGHEEKDPYAATRRAIVRAAAAIGENGAPSPTAEEIEQFAGMDDKPEWAK